MLTTISRTPYRISFFGGGTDYSAWYRQHGGAVLSMAIDKYCYISAGYLEPFFSVKHKVVWSHIETVDSIADIKHPVVRHGLKYTGYDDSSGVELFHHGDLPARSGIGSSSSFAVGLINALSSMRGRCLDSRDLALKAIDLEQNVIGDVVGCQDQIAAAYGGLNVVRFNRDDTFSVTPLDIPESTINKLESWLMLFPTRNSRLSSDFAKRIINNIDLNTAHMRKMHEMVDEGVKLLRLGQLNYFGRLLHESWMLKRSLAVGTTNSVIDRVYDEAFRAGACGGKLLGAGGTGFMAFIVPPDNQLAVSAALQDLIRVPVRVDFTGSKIIYERKDR